MFRPDTCAKAQLEEFGTQRDVPWTGCLSKSLDDEADEERTSSRPASLCGDNGTICFGVMLLRANTVGMGHGLPLRHSISTTSRPSWSSAVG
jgi:hypothetical protein